MTQSIRCISIDIDGTLLVEGCHSSSKISENNIKAIKDYCSIKTNKVILATGRGVHETLYVFEYLCGKGLTSDEIPYLICLNGGIILDTKNLEKPISNKSFDHELCKEICQYLCSRKYNFFIFNDKKEVYHPVRLFSFLIYSIAFKHKSTNRQWRVFKDLSNIQKIIIILKLPWVKWCKKRFKKTSFADKCYFSAGPKFYIEIVDKKINKYFGILEVARRMGLTVEDFSAIGNEQNDIMSLENVGFGVGVNLNPKYLSFDSDKIQCIVSNEKGQAVHDAIYEMKKRKLW